MLLTHLRTAFRQLGKQKIWTQNVHVCRCLASCARWRRWDLTYVADHERMGLGRQHDCYNGRNHAADAHGKSSFL